MNSKPEDIGILVDGKYYPVKEVLDMNPWIAGIGQYKKEVVEIDGKEYNVKTVRDPIFGKAKKVVEIDGKEYEVDSYPLQARQAEFEALQKEMEDVKSQIKKFLE